MLKVVALSETRIKILKLLLVEDNCPSMISKKLGIKEFAIRRHLDLLEKEGLVTFSYKKTGDVGRPLKVYTLTENGKKLEIFPKQHAKMLALLIDDLIKRYGKEFAISIFSDAANEMAKQFSSYIKSQDLESKCRELTKALNSFGKCSDLAREGEWYVVYIHNCVFNEIAKIYGDLICGFMDQAIKNALGGNILIVRQFSIARGDKFCKRLIKELAPDQLDKL
ncbi:MAG: ArsR family transcriptional regulator [Methanocellales archaeon]